MADGKLILMIHIEPFRVEAGSCEMLSDDAATNAEQLPPLQRKVRMRLQDIGSLICSADYEVRRNVFHRDVLLGGEFDAHTGSRILPCRLDSPPATVFVITVST